jgi:hypothetical protein
MAAWPCMMGHQAETSMGGLSQARSQNQPSGQFNIFHFLNFN